ncbi:MAG: glycogenin glucosyltransferase [Vezdaea aestivalis]|nr:MAG: glycogenin glucosyltransferase [Vezdaea aestivalis]
MAPIVDEREDAYCTLLITDSYLPGAVVLAHSLRDAGTKKKLAALIILENLAADTITELKRVYDYVIPVELLTNQTPANLYLMNRPDLGSTFTKINLWRQEQFRKIVYVDADVVALRAPDELFNLPSTFAAAPDIGWPDCFNSGVMVLNPNAQDYFGLLALAQRGISFDGADQGLLNMYFRQYDRMSFTYNCTPSGHYQYVPAYRHFQSSISMIHFIGADKPWLLGNNSKSSNSPYDEMLGRWWAVYDRHYKVPAAASISGQGKSKTSTVRKYVKGETIDYGYTSTSSAAGSEIEPQSRSEESRPEESRSEPERATIEPTHTHPERKFSAPLVIWNPARSAPPTDSRAEAAHFEAPSYTMSTDRGLFEAPKSYPAPPKDMWYEVPTTAPEAPKPIFPWEQGGPRNKATRVFADDAPPPDEPAEAPPLMLSLISEPKSVEGPASPTTPSATADPWQSYSHTNAWDEMPDIERYMESIARARRGKVQVLVGGPNASTATPEGERRPSFRVTDFPTALERPSLPVTPAPIRRSSFWGADGDAADMFPAAEGVPDQAEWDPAAQLDELTRRSSIVLPAMIGNGKGKGKGRADEYPPEEAVETDSPDDEPRLTTQHEEQTDRSAMPTEPTPPASTSSPFAAKQEVVPLMARIGREDVPRFREEERPISPVVVAGREP